MSISNTPRPVMPVTTPMGVPERYRYGPCSMCSSKYAANSPGLRAASSTRDRSPPMSPMRSLSDTPSASTAARSSGSSIPAMARLPISQRWNRVPSSLVKTIASRGWRVVWPFSASVLITSMAPITPRAPSYLPPSGTVSVWEPMAMAGNESSVPAFRPMMLPPVSMRISRPASRIRPMVYSRLSTSAGEKARRSMPSGVSPNLPSSSRVLFRRAALMASPGMAGHSVIYMVEVPGFLGEERNWFLGLYIALSNGCRKDLALRSFAGACYELPRSDLRLRLGRISRIMSSSACRSIPSPTAIFTSRFT